MRAPAVAVAIRAVAAPGTSAACAFALPLGNELSWAWAPSPDLTPASVAQPASDEGQQGKSQEPPDDASSGIAVPAGARNLEVEVVGYRRGCLAVSKRTAGSVVPGARRPNEHILRRTDFFGGLCLAGDAYRRGGPWSGRGHLDVSHSHCEFGPPFGGDCGPRDAGVLAPRRWPRRTGDRGTSAQQGEQQQNDRSSHVRSRVANPARVVVTRPIREGFAREPGTANRAIEPANAGRTGCLRL